MLRVGDIAIYLLPCGLALTGLLFAVMAWGLCQARHRRWQLPGLAMAALAPLLMAATVTGLPIAPTNAIMGAYPSWQSLAVLRLGVNIPGDARPQWFIPSATPCGISGGDVGSQVPTIDGGCMNAPIPPEGADVRNWNQLPTPMTGGTADATASVQAAIQAVGSINGTLLLGPYLYGIDGTGLTCSANMTIRGGQNVPTVNGKGGKSGFVALATNETLLTMTNGCSGTKLENLFFNMGAAGSNSAGAAISMSGAPVQVLFDNISMTGACVGIDLDGNNDWVDKTFIEQDGGGANCFGIRVGFYTTNGTTVGGGILDTTIQGYHVTPPAVGMLFLDAGGYYLHDDDVLYTVVGTEINPGPNQRVSGFYGDSTVLGDSTSSSPLVITTSDPTAKVLQISCAQCWVATTASGSEFGSPSAAPNISISNAASATAFDGFIFTGLRDYGGTDGIYLSGAPDVTISNSHICSYGIGYSSGGPYLGVEMASQETLVTLTGNDIRPGCDNGGGAGLMATGYAIGFDSSNQTGITVVANDLHGNLNGPFDGSPTYSTGLTTTNNIALNNGVVPQTLAAAATITLNVTDDWNTSGTTTVTQLNTCWPGRTMWIYSSAATPFGTGGNIAASYTMTPGIPTLARCEFQSSAAGLWALK